MLEKIKKPSRGSWLNKGQSKLSKKKIVYSALLSIAIAALAVSIYLATRPAEVLRPPGYTPITPQTECQQLKAQVKDLIEKANYCQQDSDCQVISLLTCPFGCYPLLNKQANLSEILQKVDQYKKDCQPLCEYKCAPTPESTDVKCLNGKCADSRIDQTITQEVTIATDKTIYSQGEEIKITTRNNSSTTIYLLNPFEQVEKLENGKWQEVAPIMQCPCGWKCEEKIYEVLEPGKEKIVSWDQQYIDEINRYKDCKKIQAKPGIYRIGVTASPDPDNPTSRTISQPFYFYSNEFTLTTDANVPTTDEEIMRAIWNTSGNNYEYPISLKDIFLPQLSKIFPHHRFIQAELGKTSPPSYTIVATDKVAKSNVYIMHGQFNALLVDNQISIEESNLIDIAKIFALMASPKAISQLFFIDQSLINETIEGFNYQVKLTTYSKINGIKEEWKFSIRDRQVQDVVVKTIDVGVGNYIEDIEGPSPSKGSLRIYNPKVYPQN